MPTELLQHAPTTAATLFCYVVVSDFEVPLLRVHRETRNGIFGCGEWAIFTNASGISGLRDPRGTTAEGLLVRECIHYYYRMHLLGRVQ